MLLRVQGQQHSRACLYWGLSRRRTRARIESGMPTTSRTESIWAAESGADDMTVLSALQKIDSTFSVSRMKPRTEASKKSPAQIIAEPDIVGKIKGLAELKDMGALSEDEFQAKKAELLSRL